MAFADFEPVGPQDCMSVEVVRAACRNQRHLARQAAAYQRHPVPLKRVDITAGAGTQPTPDFMNRVEGNLDRLLAALPWPTPHAPTRHWLGEWRDTPLFCHRDVNRWFETLQAMKDLLDFAQTPARVGGAFTSGGDIRLQVMRRG